jgi:hypothetical protein
MELQDGEVIPKGNTTYSEGDALPYNEAAPVATTEEVPDNIKRNRYYNELFNVVKDRPEVAKFNLKPKADTDIVTDDEIAGLQYQYADVYNKDKYEKGKLVGIPYKPLNVAGDSSPFASINYKLGDQIENALVEKNNKETLTEYNTEVTKLNDPSLTIANSIDEVDPKKLSYVQYKKQRQSIPELPDVASSEDITPEHMAKLQVAMAAKTWNSIFEQVKDNPEVIALGYKPKKYDDIVSPKEEEFLEEQLKNKLNKKYADDAKSLGMKFTPVDKLWDFNSGITDPIDNAKNKKNEDEWLANTNKLAKQYGIAPFKSVEDYDQTHVAKWDAYNTKQLNKNNSTIAELNKKLPVKERFPIVKTNEEYQFIFPKLKAAATKVQAAEVKKFEAKQVKEASSYVDKYNLATNSNYTLPKTKGEAKLVLEKIKKDIKYKKSLEWTTETIPYEVTVAENKNGFYAESGRGNSVVVPKGMVVPTKEQRELAAKKEQDILVQKVQKLQGALNKTPEAKIVFENLQALDNRFAPAIPQSKNLDKVVKTGQVYTVTASDIPSVKTAPSAKEMAIIAQDDKLRSKEYNDKLQKQQNDLTIAFEALNKNAQDFKISSDALKQKINKEGYTEENKTALNALDEQQKTLISQSDVLSDIGTLNKIYAGNIFESKAKIGSFGGAAWNNLILGVEDIANGTYSLNESLGMPFIQKRLAAISGDSKKVKDLDAAQKSNINEFAEQLKSITSGVKANVSEEYMQKKDLEGSIGGVLMQLPRSVPAMIISEATPLGFAAFALQDYGTRLREAINDPKNANLTMNQLVAATLPISIVNGAIEQMSMKSLGTSMAFLNLTKKVGSKIAAKELLSAKIYSNFLKEGVDAVGLTKYVPTNAIKVAGVLVEQANTEAFENLMQEIATNINNSIANKVLKGDNFQVNNDANAYWKSLKSGWIGGFAFGAITTAGYTIANDIKVESINNKQFQLVREALQDPAILKSYVTDIKLKIANKEITLDDGKLALASIKEFGYIASKIPTDISVANQKKAFDLIKERMAIEQEVKGKDESLTLAKKQRITEINKQLQAISLETVAAVDNGQVVTTNADGTVTTTPAKTIDGVGTYEFEGKLYVEDKDGNIKLEDGTSVTDQKTIDKIKEEGIFNKIAPTAAQKVETLRAAEQAELDEKIPNAEQYRVNGKVDRTKLTNDTDRKAFDEVYAKYDKLITPLLEKTAPKTRTVFDSLPVGIKASEGQPTRRSHVPLFAAAKTALKVLNEIFPNLEIHFHENSNDFQKVLDATANGKKASTTDGNFAYIKDKDGNYIVRIDINLSHPNASVTTVIHEAIHPILLSEFDDNPESFKELKDEVSKSVSDTKNEELKEFIKAYEDEQQPEEYLVQLGAILKDNEKIEPNVFRRIAEAINKIVLRITKGKFKPFEDVKNSNETVRYFSSLVEAIRTGDLSKTKLRSQSQKAGAPMMGSKQSRGGLTATDMKSMTVADNGDLLFFHYGDIKGSKVDARKGTPKAYTTDKRVYTTNYYYTNESDREGMVGGKVNVVRVPADKVYSFNKDVLGLFDEAKKNSEAQSKGQAFSPNRQADFIAQLAARNGFDMMVAKWGNGYRAESPKALPIDAALTKQMRTNGSLSTAAVDDKLNQDIYNAAASKANGNSEKYRSAFYGIKDITAKDIMENPILSRGIPKKLADKYNSGQVRSKQSISGVDTEDINNIGVSGVINSNGVKSKSSISSGVVKRFPVNKNVKVQEDVPMANFNGKVSNLIESDRMTGGWIGDEKGNVLYRFYGGVFYPIITGKWWASRTEKKARAIANNGNKNRDADGYVYSTPMIGSNKQHMSNIDMLSVTVELMKSDVTDKKSRVRKEDILTSIDKAFNRKSLKNKRSVLRDILKKSNNIAQIFDELEYVLFQEGSKILDRDGSQMLDEYGKPLSNFSFKERLAIVNTILGDPKVKEVMFPSAGSITEAAKRFEEPITAKSTTIGDAVTVMRTKGTLRYKKTDKTDKFYHKSYPVEIYAVDEDGNPAEIEVYVLDGAYGMRNTFPSLTKSSGGTFTYADYATRHKYKSENYTIAQYNRTAKMSNAAGEIYAEVRSKQSLKAGDKVKIDGVSVTIPSEAQQDLLKQERTAKSYFDEKVRLMEPSPLSKEEINSILNRDDIAILTGTNPDGNAVSDNTNSLLNKKAEDWLKGNGYTYHQVTGKYGQTESSFLVEGMTGDVALEFAKIFKQDSVLQSEGLIYREGTIEKRIADGDAFGLDVTEPDADYVSAIKTKTGEVVGFQFGIDLGNKVQYEIKSKQSVNAWQGGPHNFNKEILVSYPDGKTEYIVGTPEEFPEIPKSATVVKEFPNGRMRTDKIGTGEGAQAFGWGLYFTDIKNIAENYARKLSSSYTYSGVTREEIKGFHPMVKPYLFSLEATNPKNKQDALEWLNKNKKGKSERTLGELLSAIQGMEFNVNKGYVYNASLHQGKTPDQYTWLEWDKKIPKELEGKLTKAIWASQELTGREKETLTPLSSFDSGSGLYNAMAMYLGGQKQASEFLLDFGIDGIKYPAESLSRGATSDTARGFNYVVFDENAVTIKSKQSRTEDALKDVESTAKALESVDDDKKEKLENISGVLYHGTEADFDKFEKVGSKIPALGLGYYFTPTLEKAKSYGSKIKKIGLKNAKVLNWNKLTDDERLKIKERLKERMPKSLMGGLGIKNEKSFTKEQRQEASNFYAKKREETDGYEYERGKARIKRNDGGWTITWSDEGIDSVNDAELLNFAQQYDNQIASEMGYDAAKYGNETVIFDNDKIEYAINKVISESYHKAKADGSNPELVKAVEEAIGGANEVKSKQSRTEDAKSAYEAKLEENLEQLRDAYGNARKADTGVRKIAEDSPTSVGNFIKRLINGATPEAAAEAKAKLVEMQRKYRKEKAEMRAMLPRERGVNFIIEKLSRAARNGDITQDEADLAIYLLRKSPSLFGDLAISITSGNKKANGDGVQGWYRAADELVKIFKNPKDPLTVTHELLHHTERFLPQEVRDGIIKEWHAQVQRQAADIASKLKTEKDTDTRQQLTQALLYLGLAEARQLEPDFFNAMAMENIMKKYLSDHTDSKGNFNKGLGDSWYQLYNPSEWWAVNASKIFSDAKNKPALKTWADKAKAFYNYLIDSIKKVFKGNPIANVEKGLKAILEGNTLENMEGNMLANSKQSLNIKQKESFEQRNLQEGGDQQIFSKQSRVSDILNDTFNQEAKKTKIDKLDIKALAKKVVDIVKSSKLYEQTDDIERDNAIIDFLKSKGIAQKRVIEPRNKNIISVNEVTALKDQIRLEIKAANDGAKSIEDAIEKIGEIIKGLSKGKKISVTSAKALINKFSNMNTANKDSVKNVLDYAEKIFNDAEYADKVSQVRALNAAMKRAAKNSAIPPATRSIALSFAKINPEAISDIDAHLEAANKIKDATLGVKENGVRIRKAIDINAMADYIKSAMAEQDAYDAKNPTITRVVEPLDEGKTLEYLSAMHDSLLQAAKAVAPSAVLTKAEEAQLKNFLKIPFNEFNTIKDKIAAVEALDNFVKNGMMGKIPFILNTQQVNANIKKGVDAIMPKLTSVSLMWFSEQKAKIRGLFDNMTYYRSNPKDYSKKLAYFMNQSIRRIDSLIGNLENNAVFNNTFKAMASGYSKYLFKISSMDADVIFQKVLASFNGSMYKAVQHCYKTTMFMLQLEYESNIGNTEVIPAIKHLNETLKSGNLTNKDKAELRKLIDEFSTLDVTTGERNIDIAKIWDSFNEVEKNAVKMLASYYEKLLPYAHHVAVSLRDVPFNPRANYVMLNVVNEKESLANLAPSELKAGFIEGSTKAGTINARDGNPHAISLDPYNTFNVANRDIMMDYCLLNPIKTVTAIFDKLVEDTAGDEKANDVAKSLQFIFDETTRSIIGRSVVMSDKIWNDVFNYIKKVGARYMLAKVDKAPAELAGNSVFAMIAYTENVLEGIKHNAYQRNFELSQAMENLNSYSMDKLYPHKGQSGAYLDPNSFDIDVRDKKHFIDGASNAVLITYYNTLLQVQKGGQAVSEFLVASPDVVVARFVWEGTFRLEFKKETGVDVDFKKVTENDYDYLEKYKDALDKATAEADRVIVDIANSKNPFIGIAKESVRRDWNSAFSILDGFLRSFPKTENQLGIDAAYAVVKGGKISRGKGARILAAILARSGVYNVVRAAVLSLLTGVGFAIVNGITGGDDSEEKRRRRARMQLDYMNVEGDDWAEKSPVVAGKKILYAGNIYEVVTGGITSANPPSDTSGKIITDGTAKYKWVGTIPRIQGSITGIKDNVSMGNSLRTYDKEFIEKAKKAAAPEETMSHSFNKGAIQSVVGIMLSRNSGAMANNLLIAPLVEYANEKYIHPAISSDPYDKYRDGIMYSKGIDRSRKDPELNFIVDNSGVLNPALKAAITGYRMFDDKYGDRLREVNKKIEDHEKGVKVPREESSKEKYYGFIAERDALLEKQKPVKIMMAKNILITALTLTGILPSGKTIDAIADKTLQDKILSPSDMDNIIKNIENARNYSGGGSVRLENPKDNDKVLVYPDIYTDYILQGRKIPAKKP